MQEKIGKKELTVRDFFERAHGGRVPQLTVQQLYTQFMTQDQDSAGISYGLFNGVVKKLRFETGDSLVPGPGQSTIARPSAEAQANSVVEINDEPEIFEIGSMQFPDFRKFKTGTVFDQLMSDHDAEGGVFSGTANIVIGESGVGKSTITLDLLAKIKQQDPTAKILYISSEMTRNDLYFYYRKMPIIETIPTLLVMDYLMGRFDKTLEKAINGDHDVILIDSHQDIIIKLKDVLGWKSTKAETWLTNLIIEAADKKGKAIFAIQHMTKGGEYVGSTYLKHATTSMMEIRKDETGRRYAEFSKNRRGGSLVGKRLYYSLVNGEVKWDEAAWRQENVVSELAEQESDRRQHLESEFNSLFLSVKRPKADEDEAQAEA